MNQSKSISREFFQQVTDWEEQLLADLASRNRRSYGMPLGVRLTLNAASETAYWCLSIWFPQLLDIAQRFPGQIAAKDHVRWAEGIASRTLRRQHPDLLPVLRRFVLETRRSQQAQPDHKPPQRTRERSQKSLNFQDAKEELALLWKKYPKATYTEIREYADEANILTPWTEPLCRTWADAFAFNESRTNQVLIKARNKARRSPSNF